MRMSGLFMTMTVLCCRFWASESISDICPAANKTYSVCNNGTYDVWKNMTLKYINETIRDKETNVTLSLCVTVRNATGDDRGKVLFLFHTKNSAGQYDENRNCSFKVDKDCDPETTSRPTTSPSTTSTQQSTKKTAEDLDNKSTKATKNEKWKNGKQVVIRPNTTHVKSVFDSDISNTKVKSMEINGVIPKRVVVIGQKIDKNKSPEPNESKQNTLKDVQVFASSEFISVAAYDDEGTKLDVSSLELSFDVSEADTSVFKTELQNLAGSSGSLSRAFTISFQPVCSFFDAGDQKWSSDGCEMKAWVIGQSVDCHCDHTTVFAVMMSADVVVVPAGVKIVSYVTELISIFFLLVTVVLLYKVRNRVRGDRVKVQICLASSLLALHALNVMHDAVIGSNTACEIWAVMTHYSLLCSAMWMFMEGLTLVFKTMDSVMRVLSGQNARKFAIFRYVVSFSVPALIVLISAAVGFSSYGDNDVNTTDYMPMDTVTGKYQHCWVDTDMLVGAVVVPVAVILFFCTLFVFRMFYVVYRMSSESEKFRPADQRRSTSGEMEDLEHVKAALKATMVLLPVLGVTWLLGFFTGVQNGDARVGFMYLNVIVNGLQGVMIFFVYCVMGKEVRKAIANSFARKRHSLPSFFEFSSNRRMTTDLTASTTVQGTTFSAADPDLKSGSSEPKGSPTSSDAKESPTSIAKL